MTTNVNNNESVKVVVNAQVAEVAPDTTGLNYASMNKAFREILVQTRSMNQAVKVFGGLMGTPIEVKGEVRTIGEWLQLTGVKVVKSKLVLNSIKEVWKFRDEQGEMQLWRNVPCMTMAEDPKDRQRVYTYDEDKAKWVAVTRYQRVTIGKNGWSADVILRGLLQATFAQKELDKGAASAQAFDEIEHLYVFNKRIDKGGVDNKAKEVSKDRVQF